MPTPPNTRSMSPRSCHSALPAGHPASPPSAHTTSNTASGDAEQRIRWRSNSMPSCTASWRPWAWSPLKLARLEAHVVSTSSLATRVSASSTAAPIAHRLHAELADGAVVSHHHLGVQARHERLRDRRTESA